MRTRNDAVGNTMLGKVDAYGDISQTSVASSDEKATQVGDHTFQGRSTIEYAGGESELLTYTDYRLNQSRFKWFWRASLVLDRLGEARGIERRLPHDRSKSNASLYFRLTAIWFGATCSLPSMTGFFIGTLSFGLSFRASVSAGVLGVFVGSMVGALGAVMGPRSGLRSMIGVRFQFGWWFSKFINLVAVCTLLGWLIVNGNFGGQLLNALSNDSVSIRVGIFIVFIASLFFAVFGIRPMSWFETALLIPLVVAFLLCYVRGGDTFDVHTHSIHLNDGTPLVGVDLNSAWVSFFQSCIGITSTWIGMASDYHLVMPERTNPVVNYVFALLVMFLPTAFVGILGSGLASAGLKSMEKREIYANTGGGGLIVEAMKPWGGGGKFLVVIMFISLITNGTLTNYSLGLAFQALGTPIAQIPRYILVIFGGCIYFVLSEVGVSGWAEVVGNFLPMIGYWSMIYGTILAIETFWFRRHKKDEYQWEQYLNRRHFPLMFAAFFAFWSGVAGVVVGMDQYYYVGRLARLIGTGGAELGTLLAVGFSAVTYIPLRYLEIYLRHDSPIKP